MARGEREDRSMVYHIATELEWERAQRDGIYRPVSLARDGFIHCSSAKQVASVANKLYAGRTDLLLLCIDEGKTVSPIRYEDLYGTGQLYPHIYGALNVDAVVAVKVFRPGPDGGFSGL